MTPNFDRHLRTENLDRLGNERFDLLVVGGGITGAGVALDAATRGLRTALVERSDFASGTSSRSSKIIHGGLRYLQHGELRLVAQGLRERQRLMRIAPHLVRPLPHVIPIFRSERGTAVTRAAAKAVGSALWMYDLAGGVRIGKLHRRLRAADMLERVPALAPEHVIGGFLYYDARADDARLTLSIIRTAALDHGAVVANYVQVRGIAPERDDDGAMVVELCEQIGGAALHARANVVINATGIWADDVRALDEGEHPRALRPAKGVHIAVPAEKLPTTVAVVLPVRSDRRSVFAVPWGAHTYIGTTDTDYDGPLDDPHCTAEDVEYLLAAVNVWTRTPLTPQDVTGSWAGLRPLLADAHTDRTADLSRRHSITVSPHGVVTVTGGKLTTYRQMAADAVDTALQQLKQPGRLAWLSRLDQLGRSGPLRHLWRRQSKTKRLRLHGTHEYRNLARDPGGSAARLGCTRETFDHLLARYGGETPQLTAMLRDDASLAEPLVSGLPYLRVEAQYAVQEEMAMTLDDVLTRRTRAALLDRDATKAAAGATADLIAAELGWGAQETQRQIDDLHDAIQREHRANTANEG